MWLLGQMRVFSLFFLPQHNANALWFPNYPHWFLTRRKKRKKKKKKRKLWPSIKFKVVNADNSVTLCLGLSTKKSNYFTVFDIDLQGTGLQNKKKIEKKTQKLMKKKKVIAAAVVKLIELAWVLNNHIHIRFKQEKTVNLINKIRKQIKLFKSA